MYFLIHKSYCIMVSWHRMSFLLGDQLYYDVDLLYNFSFQRSVFYLFLSRCECSMILSHYYKTLRSFLHLENLTNSWLSTLFQEVLHVLLFFISFNQTSIHFAWLSQDPDKKSWPLNVCFPSGLKIMFKIIHTFSKHYKTTKTWLYPLLPKCVPETPNYPHSEVGFNIVK